MRDGSVMVDSDLAYFLSRSTDSAINFSGSTDFHTPIHPPLKVTIEKQEKTKTEPKTKYFHDTF